MATPPAKTEAPSNASVKPDRSPAAHPSTSAEPAKANSLWRNSVKTLLVVALLAVGFSASSLTLLMLSFIFALDLYADIMNA